MQRFVRYRRSLSGKPLLSRLFGRRVDALILDRAAVLAGYLQRDDLADEREECRRVFVSLLFKVFLSNQ